MGRIFPWDGEVTWYFPVTLPPRVGVMMAAWVFDCPACHKTFAHSQITTEPGQRMMDHFYPINIKPEVPPTGLSVECPNCGSSSVFKQHQLRYQTH